MIHDEAAAWHAASLRDDMDWEGFTSWLEADSRHASAYDEVALTDRLLAEHAPALVSPEHELRRAANDDVAQLQPSRSLRRGWLVTGLAASLAMVLAVPQFLRDDMQVYRAQATPLNVALADGSAVTLAPRSRLEVSADGTQLALDGGAWFDIRHDPSRSLSIAAGGLTITDIGTRFDVQARKGSLRIEMDDGEVRVEGPVLSVPLRLTKGRSLSFESSAGTALVQPVAQADIGEWRSGRLSYDQTPLALVADDLARYAGVKVEVADGLADRQFSGTLVIGDGERALQDLAQLVDVRISGSAGRYRLDERR